MSVEYIEDALERARYEIIRDDEPYYGEVTELQGVWATGLSLEECRESLREVLEGWIRVRMQKGLSIPSLENRQPRFVKEMAVHA